MKNIQETIDIFGGMARLPDNYIRLETPGYMRLVIEAIGPGPRGLPSVSVAHYGEQNGDAMRDPEMTFEIDREGAWHPVTFLNDYVGLSQEAVFQDDAGSVMIRPRLVKELKAFARTWNTNIKKQGWIEVARAEVAKRIASN